MRTRLGRGFSQGFTIVELLVTITILGLLATIAYADLREAREQARYARAEADLRQIVARITEVTHTNEEVLADTTEYWCSDCLCRHEITRGVKLSSLPDDHPCIESMRITFERLGLPLLRDPWGSPYLIDENEHEYDWDGTVADHEAFHQCRSDTVNSAGPDGVFDIDRSHPNWEDKLMSYDTSGLTRLVPYYACPPYEQGVLYPKESRAGGSQFTGGRPGSGSGPGGDGGTGAASSGGGVENF